MASGLWSFLANKGLTNDLTTETCVNDFFWVFYNVCQVLLVIVLLESKRVNTTRRLLLQEAFRPHVIKSRDKNSRTVIFRYFMPTPVLLPLSCTWEAVMKCLGTVLSVPWPLLREGRSSRPVTLVVKDWAGGGLLVNDVPGKGRSNGRNRLLPYTLECLCVIWGYALDVLVHPSGISSIALGLFVRSTQSIPGREPDKRFLFYESWPWVCVA